MASTLMRPQRSWVNKLTRSDAGAGVVLLAAAVIALLIANSPLNTVYETVSSYEVGPSIVGLHLSVRQWVSDGLLAVFFFTVGLDLKEECTSGFLRDPKLALLPIAAAFGGVICPAVVYVLAILPFGGEALRGWAIPTATDIAFAVSILAMVGKGLPHQLRAFLLTLAVVDDLIGIAIIAVYYTNGIHMIALAAGIVALVAVAILLRNGVTTPMLIVPLACVTWGFVHASGIHPTIAGVALGLCVPANKSLEGEDALTRILARKFAAFSKLVVVPVFALFSIGVNLGGVSGFIENVHQPVTLAIIVALVCGKMLGITGTTFILTRFPLLNLPKGLHWPDMVGLGFVAGIGFTVSMLIGELAFGEASAFANETKIGILLGSLISASIGATVLHVRARKMRALALTQ